ncbi:hypothetical protein NLG97_g1314 [Lecanicillium saksenae]|uniref:Uncharacterized protein n=1 Tax=Lecanicillium saksenae TaxID=468837 RepID=A0ACC1R5H8_9HYPO|nr:hypothetical protein NLG97_g1314 [Lecanicillium saksenae]
MADGQSPQATALAEQHRPHQQHPLHSSSGVLYLSDDEIAQFIDEMDQNHDGLVEYSDIKKKLDELHDELVGPDDAQDSANRHNFLRSLMVAGESIPESQTDSFTRDQFTQIVRGWNIPSLKQMEKEEDDERSYFSSRRIFGWRRVRAYLSVQGPKIAFLAFVVAMELAFGLWQLIKYQTVHKYRAALGWGVVMSKTNAGMLYATFFFLILSMSRYFSTFVKRWYLASRYTSVLFTHEFHITMSCIGLLQATLHALGHLAAGTFRHGSNPKYQDAVAVLFGPDAVPRTYTDYIRSLPGWTGLVGIGMFYLLSLLSIPQVRRWNYELFQLGHLLMFPIIGLMMAHGTAALLQWPMFGYFLAFPTLLVIIERTVRVSLGFVRTDAMVEALDDATVEIVATLPRERMWRYRAGQYVLVQVPAISFFEWHPFTVSFRRGSQISLHVKAGGNWTRRLCELAGKTSKIQVGINGPFGAPAQHFYDFDQSMIIGAGIGVTPFAGILADLQHKDDLDHGGPDRHQTKCHGSNVRDRGQEAKNEFVTPPTTASGADAVASFGTPVSGDDTMAPSEQGGNTSNTVHINSGPASNIEQDINFQSCRRIDFHWMVRNRNSLLWFANLLNEVSQSQIWHHDHEVRPHLDIRINTHITAKHKTISTHVYRWLLEMHRTNRRPESLFTGLLNPTHFGRPDFDKIFDEHYRDMCKLQIAKNSIGVGADGSRGTLDAGRSNEKDKTLKVGVFYCGAPAVGEILADKCAELTARSRYDGNRIQYRFMIEIF